MKIHPRPKNNAIPEEQAPIYTPTQAQVLPNNQMGGIDKVKDWIQSVPFPFK